MQPDIILVDYCNPRHGADLVALLNHYASGEAGGGVPLTADVQKKLPVALSQLPHAFSRFCRKQKIGKQITPSC